jgi:hypothetical protein
VYRNPRQNWISSSVAAALATASVFAFTGNVRAAGDWTLPTIVYGSGVVGYARLGVGNAYVVELTDRTDVLSTPAAQAWIDDFFAHLAAVMPDAASKEQLSSLRGLLVVDSGYDRERSLRALQSGVSPLINRLPADDKRAYAAGLLTEQIYYNASTLRDATYDREFRQALSAIGVLDSSLDGFADQRSRLAQLDQADWKSIAATSRSMLADILGAH